MSRVSKRKKELDKKIGTDKNHTFGEAIKLAKENANCKFDECIDVDMNLNIKTDKSDQGIRGSVILPFGTGKKVRVAVFVKDDQKNLALEAGADLAGNEDLSQSIQEGKIDFDVCISTPEMMSVVGKLGQILGPKGLMPNPKVGTVTKDFVNAIKAAKTGQVQFRTDKAGIVHTSIGKSSFDEKKLIGNFEALLEAIKKSKSDLTKGSFIEKITVSSTMGPSIGVELAGINN